MHNCKLDCCYSCWRFKLRCRSRFTSINDNTATASNQHITLSKEKHAFQTAHDSGPDPYWIHAKVCSSGVDPVWSRLLSGLLLKCRWIENQMNLKHKLEKQFWNGKKIACGNHYKSVCSNTTGLCSDRQQNLIC